jgi:hypothetical protein
MDMKVILSCVWIGTILFLTFIIASVNAFTSISYRGISKGKLSRNEWKILQGRATIQTRISVFFHSIYLSLTTPHVFILALIPTGIVWIIMLIIKI